MGREFDYFAKLLGRIGVPLFVSTLVASIFSNRFDVIHIFFMFVALVFIWIEHHFVFHKEKKKR